MQDLMKPGIERLLWNAVRRPLIIINKQRSVSDIALSRLRALDVHTCTDQFQLALRRNGFVSVEIDESRVLQGLHGAIYEARALDCFRFPPIQTDEPVQYNIRRQDAFKSLFEIAIVCLKAILLSTPTHLSVQKALERIPHHTLFENDPNEPFANAHQPFAQSFFNLFNYNHGLLNPHVDRSLVTVIFSSQTSPSEEESTNKTALWIQSPEGMWQNADALVTTPSQVVIMTGEQLAAVMPYHRYYAALHAVKVDPMGEFLAQAHHRRDPATTAKDNRVSAALILRHGD